MNWYFIFYLFSIADRLNGFFIGFMVLSAISAVACSLFLLDLYNESESLRVWRNRSLIAGICCAALVVLIPSKKDLLLIIAGGAVGQFVTTDSSAKALPADITRFLRGQILKATADLKEDVLLDGERDKLSKLSKDEVVNLLMQTKVDSISNRK